MGIYEINLIASNFEYFWAMLFILLHFIWYRHNKIATYCKPSLQTKNYCLRYVKVFGFTCTSFFVINEFLLYFSLDFNSGSFVRIFN